MSQEITRRTALKSSLAFGAATLLPSAAFSQTADDMVLGSESAKVTLIEYASFTCPHCASFHKQVYPKIRSSFIDSGKIRFVLREVYFDRFGLWAGMIARCGGALRYFGMVDLIFDQQAAWIGDRQDATVISNLYGIGRQAGMTDEDMNACMQNEEFAKSLLEAFQANSEEHDITATPSFVLNDDKLSNMGFDQIAALINEKLEE